MSDDRARRIKLIIFDVDGVLTDGKIYIFPAPAGVAQPSQPGAEKRADDGGFAIVSQNWVEAKGFNAHDGTGFTLARLGGMKTGLITKRLSQTVALRARDLKVDHVYQGQHDKIEAFRTILEKDGITADEVAYVGDDIIDLPVMERCGLAIAVANARQEVKRIAHYVTENRGGDGAARDAVEYILRAKGILERVHQEYLAARGAAASTQDVSVPR